MLLGGIGRSLVLLVVAVLGGCASQPDENAEDDETFLGMTHVLLMIALPAVFGLNKKRNIEQKKAATANKRQRRYVNDIFDELGVGYTRRAMRMEKGSFWRLLAILHPHIKGDKEECNSPKSWRNGAVNGLITPETRLSAALRYFAGGRPDDISVVHGISHTEVFNSVWKVVDAVNNAEELAITFPEDHDEQRKLALGFRRRSQAKFSSCVGAIDGMLFWTEKPNKRDCDEAECGPKKFLCGRKKKFGMTLQGVCDSDCRFLDVSIEHPASTSDYLAFITSSLYYKLEEKSLLKPGYCLFGDSAYVNTSYMTTPFKNCRAGDKDDFNFYHSQVCWQ